MGSGASEGWSPEPGSAQPDGRVARLSRGVRLAALALPVLGLLLLLALAEIALRLTLPPVESLFVFVESPLVRNDFTDRRQVRIFEGDPLLLWRLRPGLRDVVWDYTLVSTNAAHLRSDRPLTAKPIGGVRIVCLGDSVTFGYRVPLAFPTMPSGYDRSEAPYPVLLEQRLRAANPGRALEVVNMAVPGYSSRQALAWLRRDIAGLAPDIVTICLGWNDVSPRELPDRDVLRMDAAHVMSRRVVAASQLLMRATLLVRRLCRWQTKADTRYYLGSRASDVEFVANVIQAAELARAHRASVIVIAPIFGGMDGPSAEAALMTAYRATLKVAATSRGFPFLEVRELTEAAHPENAYYFPTEAIHPSAEGHRLLAGALLRVLEEEGILRSLGLSVPAQDMP